MVLWPWLSGGAISFTNGSAEVPMAEDMLPVRASTIAPASAGERIPAMVAFTRARNKLEAQNCQGRRSAYYRTNALPFHRLATCNRDGQLELDTTPKRSKTYQRSKLDQHGQFPDRDFASSAQYHPPAGSSRSNTMTGQSVTNVRDVRVGTGPRWYLVPA